MNVIPARKEKKIRKQVELMKSNSRCSICYHRREVFDDETGKIIGISNTTFAPTEGLIGTFIRYGPFNGACTTMIRRKMRQKMVLINRFE